MKRFETQKALEPMEVTPAQLAKINRLTRRPLTQEEVFIFPVVLCDNEIDRDMERFTPQSLKRLGELFVGKTGVFDHDPKAHNQSARIFDTSVEKGEGLTQAGEPYEYLRGLAYMVRCEKNHDLILEIDAGIKKEVSVGCAVEKITCSVCGANQKEVPCSHQKGKTYDGALCVHLLEEPTDAYEWSFVAVPAQKNAGVTKGAYSSGRRETPQELEQLLEESLACLEPAAAQRLKGQYDRLTQLARAGEDSLSRLRREVVKLAGICQPQLEQTVLETVCAGMDYSQLCSFEKSFRTAAREQLPLEPQLVQRKEKEPGLESSPFCI
ncbi:hypothetical protein U6B65_11000 [Oscillospiraceae bacterium MB08-C2-2]|nr:hypothetical protein U6B65_11000 [Oscillospiraceae bacterium MB08-C2-2]